MGGGGEPGDQAGTLAADGRRRPVCRVRGTTAGGGTGEAAAATETGTSGRVVGTVAGGAPVDWWNAEGVLAVAGQQSVQPESECQPVAETASPELLGHFPAEVPLAPEEEH